MIDHLDPKIGEILKGRDKDARKYICEQELPYFAIYYFPEFFTYDIAPYQYLMYDDVMRLAAGELKEVLWAMYRESAKTSIAKLFLAWCICYRKKRYINVDSYDKANAEAVLFDVAVALQTNKRLIADFGQLYFVSPSEEKTSRIKRIANFITENGIRAEAFSTQESTRGRLYQNIRPDLFVLTDIETTKTKDSYPITKKIIDHIDEMKAGLGPDGGILYEANYITEDGVVAYIEKSLKGRKDAVVRNLPVVMKGEIVWPGKYLFTDEEAARANIGIKDLKQRKISLEAKRRELGNSVFEVEMMNNPSKSEDLIFDRQVIEKKIAEAQPPTKIVAGLKLWGEFNPKHRYAIGGDTSEGVGLDSNASGIIDFTRKPALVVGTYENNQMAPDVFAHELARQGEMFGECLIGPEINAQGYATVAELSKIYPLGAIYRREVKNKLTGKVSKELGWRTTGATKPDIIFQLKSAVEDGELEILDVDLLNEMKHYAKRDLRLLKAEGGMTRHFDKLMACAIAWEMRNYALLAKEKGEEYSQPAYEPSSLSGGM